RHTRFSRDWSSDVCSSDLYQGIKARGSGYVDGGLYANNPAMVGLAQALHSVLQGLSTQQTEAPRESGLADTTGLLLLSLGNGFKSGRASCRQRVEITGVTI